MTKNELPKCPSPGCDGDCYAHNDCIARWIIKCRNCHYSSGNYDTKEKAVAAHRYLAECVEMNKKLARTSTVGEMKDKGVDVTSADHSVFDEFILEARAIEARKEGK